MSEAKTKLDHFGDTTSKTRKVYFPNCFRNVELYSNFFYLFFFFLSFI